MTKGIINLKTCTKEQLKNRINYLVENSKAIMYIYLDDIYTDNPTISYKRNNTSGYSFGEINVGYYGIDHITKKPINALINTIDDTANPLIDSVDNFTNELFEYIENTYR